MAMCARCRKTLQECESPIGKVPGCEACGHLWIGAGRLQEFQETAERRYTPETVGALRAEGQKRKQAALKREIVYCNCPECGNQLLRRTFGEMSFLLVHYCAAHGYWIHRDELDGIVDYVKRGGEVLEMRNEIETLEQQSREAQHRTRELERKAQSGGGGAPFLFPG
ncbi:MAG: hypothetical protein ACYS0F_12130 [Planctomycetota bacterium]|jgi:Zn-finger nucleic acid-binding protein